MRTSLEDHFRMEAVVEGVTVPFCVLDQRLRCAYLNARALVLVADLTDRSLTRDDLVGRAARDVFPALAGSEVEAHVLTAQLNQQTVVLELPLRDRWFHVHVSPSPQGTTVAVHEITDRKRAEAERRRRARQQSVLADLARRAATGDDLQGLLDDAVGAIVAVLEADLALIAEQEPVDDVFRLRSVAGRVPETVDRVLSPTAAGLLLAQAIGRSDPVVSEDTMVSGAGVPLVAVNVPGADRPFGALAVTRERRFGGEEVDFLAVAANVLATAVERARGERTVAEVRAAERQRLGVAEPRPIAELIEEVISNHRRLAPQWTLELRTRSLPADPLGPHGTELLHVVGEALTNARRHAEATTVSVRVWVSSGCLWASVQDDGRGFVVQASATKPDQMGLPGMRQRAALLDGRVSVASTAGEGTTVQIGIPLPDPERAGERLRLLLVEDHAAAREAMAAALAAEPDVGDVRQAGSLAEARALTEDIDVAVIDLVLPDGSGADLIDDVRRDSPDAHALVITRRADRAGAAGAMERGAAGVLTEEARLQDVIEAIRRLRRGEPLIPLAEVVELLRVAGRQRERELDDRRVLDTLTAREREVLQLLAYGLDNRTAADRLHVSPRTHRNHVANILTKLDVHSQLQALLFALRYGVVDIGRPGQADVHV